MTNDPTVDFDGWTCPLPLRDYPTIVMGRGSGGRLLLAAMRAHALGREAAIIGRVVTDHRGLVTARTGIGGTRVVDLPAGELLPRIC